MRIDEKLTFFEGVSILTVTFLYHVFNEVLPVLSASTGTAAWLSQTVSVALSFVFLWTFVLLCKQYPGKDLLQITEEVYGKPIGNVISASFFVYLLLYSAVSLNQAVDLLQVYAYSEISSLEIDVLMMLGVSIIALYSVKGLAKTVSVFLPLIFAFIAFILISSYKQYDLHLLNPILGYGAKTTLLSGVMLVSEFNGIIILGIFLTAFGTVKEFKRSALWAILASATLIIGSAVCYNMAVPYSATEDLQMGVMAIAQSNHMSRFMQRLESIFIGITVVSIVLLIGISFLAAKKLYCYLFNIEKKYSRAVIIPMSALVICLGRTLGNSQLFQNGARLITRRYGILYTFPILVLTIIITFIKKKWQKGKGIIKATSFLMVGFLFMSMFSGCVHYREPDGEIYPIIMGYDKGEKEKYRITMKFMMDSQSDTAKAMEKESEEGGELMPMDTVVMECPSFTEGINMLNATIPKKISLLHIKMLVISEELAREGVKDFVAPMIRYNEIKPTMGFVVCRNSAFDFITSDRAVLTDSLQIDMELVLDTNKESTAYYITSLSEFLYNSKSTYGDGVAMYGAVSQSKYDEEREPGESPATYISRAPSDFAHGFLPGELPVADNNRMELVGMAVFKNDKMVGALNTQECETVMFLNNTINTANFSIPDPHEPDKYFVSLQVRRVQPVKVKSWLDEDNRAHVDITAYLNGRIGISQNPDVSYMTNAKEKELLSQYLSQHISQRAEALIEKLQTDYQADILQLGRHVAGNFTTIQEWEEFNWLEQFPDAEISVSVVFNL